jgi:hypothetical protein
MLIGLYGKARSGKDSVFSYLKEKYLPTEKCVMIPMYFAHPLKETIGRNLLGLSGKQLYGDEKEIVDPRYGKTPRWLLQYLGTEVFRGIKESFWTDKLIREYKQYESSSVPVFCFIPDVRFRNEFQAVKDAGGQVWKIVRLGHHGASGGIEGHASENDLDGMPDSEFDAVLTAESGQLGFLHTQADEAFKLVLGEK